VQPGDDLSNGNGLQTSVVCLVNNPSGVVASADVTVTVRCVAPGGFAYVTNAGENTVSAYIVDVSTGELILSDTAKTGSAPAAVNAYPTYGELGWVYVANSGDSSVDGFTMDPNTGALSGSSPIVYNPLCVIGKQVCTGQNSLLFGDYNTGSFYITNGTSGNVSAVAYDGGTGQLTPSPQGLYVTDGSGATSGATTSSARPISTDYNSNFGYLMVLNQGGTLAGFEELSSTGVFTMGLIPFPRLATVDPAATAVASVSLLSSKFVFYPVVYVAGSSGVIQSYLPGHDVTGALTIALDASSGSAVRLPAGSGPVSLLTNNVHRDFLYAVNSAGVWVYAFDQDTGHLSLVSSQPAPVGAGPYSLALYNPFNIMNTLYVTNAGDGTVSAFQIDPGTGTLTALPGSPFPAGKGPSSMVVVARPQYFAP
jgi:6-phosphogluconolactonase (cycloisomerase 2 family)